MPGFVDTHRHMWQGALRNILPERPAQRLLARHHRHARAQSSGPRTSRIGDLVSALGAVNAGVTTVLDWSHIGNSPEHTRRGDRRACATSGIRAVYALRRRTPAAGRIAFPDDIRRLRSQHFSSDDQLLTLAMAAGHERARNGPSRATSARSSRVHVDGRVRVDSRARWVRDVTYIHCTTLADPKRGARLPTRAGTCRSRARSRWRWATACRRSRRRSITAFGRALSVDVETRDAGRHVHADAVGVHAAADARARSGSATGEHEPPPALLTVRDVVEFATIDGREGQSASIARSAR